MNKSCVLLLLFLTIFLTGCSEDDNKAWEPYSPLNTSSLMKQYALEDNYAQFQSLVQEGYDEDSINEMYETVRSTATSSAEINSFTLVTFDNGKTLLVHLMPVTSEKGEVLIQDVIEIPIEMASYIKEELNKKYEK
ncbi:hypothetical protein H7992_08095 [Sporosarcina sp. resist]|uniref:hypothetical protein n=1 Tax=Sporosarcina sp. resist TaxID=2762563 RepID=UPI00164D80B1|nr:hypothetical protein [Sporosarcina sp. resist]QNK89605.1 hypothetical protein H7992_08095 [Sporosarcina sp. resist]